MINLKWVPLPQADVQAYRVYRSIIGFRSNAASPSALSGLTLILAFNGTTAQAITFTGTDDAVTQINAQITGGRDLPTSDTLSGYFYVRSDIRTAPGSVEIVGGTALVALGLVERLITERSESQLLATVAAAVDPATTIIFSDPDGVSQDYYAISTIDHLADESLKSTYRQPLDTAGNVCVLEGIVCDMTGRRLVDKAVTATIVGSPQGTGAQVSKASLRTLTGPDGRYSLAILQGLIVRIEIKEIGFNRTLLVPALSFVNVADLPSDDSAQLQLDYTLGAL